MNSIAEITNKYIQARRYLYKIKKLEAKKRHIDRQLEELRETCNHSLILHLGKEKITSNEDDFAICLECGRHFRLNIEIDLETEKNINERIISVVGLIPEEYLCKCIGSNPENILVSRAHEKLLELLEEQTVLTLEDLKEEIISDLILYTNKEQEKAIRLSRCKK